MILQGEVKVLSVFVLEGVQALSYCTYTSWAVGAERMSPSPKPIHILPVSIEKY